MSVTVRPYRRGGWEVDVRVRLPDESEHRERRRAPVSLQVGGTTMGRRSRAPLVLRAHASAPQTDSERRCPRSKRSAPRFLDGYARANRQKPSGIAAKETIVHVHLIPDVGQQTIGCDHDRSRPAAETPSAGSCSEDREQRVDGAERVAEEGRRVGRHRADAVHDPPAADSESRRRDSTTSTSTSGWWRPPRHSIGTRI